MIRRPTFLICAELVGGGVSMNMLAYMLSISSLMVDYSATRATSTITHGAATNATSSTAANSRSTTIVSSSKRLQNTGTTKIRVPVRTYVRVLGKLIHNQTDCCVMYIVGMTCVLLALTF